MSLHGALAPFRPERRDAAVPPSPRPPAPRTDFFVLNCLSFLSHPVQRHRPLLCPICLPSLPAVPSPLPRTHARTRATLVRAEALAALQIRRFPSLPAPPATCC